MDESNPAVTRALDVPPALLEEIGVDSDPARSLARKLWAVQVIRTHLELKNSQDIRARMAYIERLEKAAGLGPKVAAAAGPAGAGGGFSVNIIMDTPAKKVEVVEAATVAPAIAQGDDK